MAQSCVTVLAILIHLYCTRICAFPSSLSVNADWVDIRRYKVENGGPYRQSFGASTVAIEMPFDDRFVLGRVAIEKPLE